MTTPATDIRETIIRLLGEIAPEADMASLRSDLNLRDQLDIDSMDFLNFVIALHKTFEIEIPETDYPRLSTLDGCVAYVAERR
ncbi:Acyl carrier protein [Nitrospira tepida]|uniref:Acyl carrier protein n=1 Tax=Nitrospira tepida TaxID=2973512 RepID=A0AA86N3I0_9BACT|nr:acyl carrier protein [Nitrospira tepida]CAI4033876.1 Acyl carrier protein [Nitrospira tepida]